VKLVAHLSAYGWPAAAPAERLLGAPPAAAAPRPADPGGRHRRAADPAPGRPVRRRLQPAPDIPAKLDVLRRHCEVAGTDFDRIERTCAFAFDLDDGGPATEKLLEQLRWLSELGIDTVIGRLDGDDPRTTAERLARHVIPEVAALDGRR